MEDKLWTHVLVSACGAALGVLLFGERGILFPVMPALVEMVRNVFN